MLDTIRDLGWVEFDSQPATLEMREGEEAQQGNRLIEAKRGKLLAGPPPPQTLSLSSHFLEQVDEALALRAALIIGWSPHLPSADTGNLIVISPDGQEFAFLMFCAREWYTQPLMRVAETQRPQHPVGFLREALDPTSPAFEALVEYCDEQQRKATLVRGERCESREG